MNEEEVSVTEIKNLFKAADIYIAKDKDFEPIHKQIEKNIEDLNVKKPKKNNPNIEYNNDKQEELDKKWLQSIKEGSVKPLKDFIYYNFKEEERQDIKSIKHNIEFDEEEFEEEDVMDDNGKILPHKLGEVIKKRKPIITRMDNEKILVYSNGIYSNPGKVKVKKDIRELVTGITRHKMNETIEYIKNTTYKSKDDLSSNEWEIALKNGVYDIKEKELQDFSPDKILQIKLPIEYNPEADCPRFKEYLKQVLPNEKDRKRLQELLGTALVKDKLHKKGCIIVGPTDAGKSTFISVIRGIFGEENVSKQTPQALCGRWGSSKIRNKVLNATDEVKAGNLANLAKLKQIMDGNYVTAERKGEQTFEFKPTCEHIFAANQTPSANRKDDAFWNRWIVITAPESISEEDQIKNLDDKLLEEREGIFNWVLEGLYDFLDNDMQFTHPESWEEARDKWLNWGDSIQRFIQQCVVRDSGNKVSSGALYERYQEFVEMQDGLEIKDQKVVTKQLKQLDYTQYSRSYKIAGRKQRGFKNISIELPQESEKNTNNNDSDDAYDAESQILRDNFSSNNETVKKSEKNRHIRHLKETTKESQQNKVEGLSLDNSEMLSKEELENELEYQMENGDRVDISSFKQTLSSEPEKLLVDKIIDEWSSKGMIAEISEGKYTKSK